MQQRAHSQLGRCRCQELQSLQRLQQVLMTDTAQWCGSALEYRQAHRRQADVPIAVAG